MAGQDLHLEGTQAAARGELRLVAGRDVVVESATSSQVSSESTRMRSAAVGVQANVGLRTGPSVGLTGEASASGSRDRSMQLQHLNAQLVAGGGLRLDAGRDATIAGARLSGERVSLDVGGNLVVASRADTGAGSHTSYHAGASGYIGVAGGSSFSASLGGGRGNSQRTWVSEQTAITAGDALTVDVGGHTQVDGAVLAAANDNLWLRTGTFGFSDLVDVDESSHVQATVGIRASRAANGEQQKLTPQGSPVGGTLSGTVANHNREQLTRATVGGGHIVVRDEASQTQDLAALNRDVDAAQEITRDESSGVTFYLSTSALEEIGSGFAGVRGDVLELSLQAEQEFPAFVSGLKEVSKTLSRGMLDMVPALSYRQNDLGSLKQRALQSGADPASVDALFSNSDFVSSLRRSQSALNSAEKNGWQHRAESESKSSSSHDDRVNVVTFDYRMTDGEKVLYSLGEVRNVLSTLPPEQVQAASIVLQTAIGGPFGVVKGYLIEKAKDLTVGDAIEKVTASTTVGIHNALTGKEWDEEYSWEGKAVTQSGARLTAELLIAGVGSGGAGGVAKGLGKGSPSPAAKGPTGVKEPAAAGNAGRGPETNRVVGTVDDAAIPGGRRTGYSDAGSDRVQPDGSGRQTPQWGNGNTQPHINQPATIGNRDYSGHALDQMQNRGVTPSVVEHTIETGTPKPGNRPGTTEYVDHINGVNVILNSDGRVITVK